MNVRKAASLLLTFTSPARSGKDCSKVMLLKRGSKSKFMPNVSVFPGGVLDQSDCSKSWRELYNFGEDSFSTISAEISDLRVYSNLPGNAGIPSEVAFRICAIREAFEESGILLARSIAQYPNIIGCRPGEVKPVVKVLNDSDSTFWREKVRSDSSNFLAMCQHLECLPDIHSLAEWANWLTPLNYKIRFDTMFYICLCDTEPESKPDRKEISTIHHAVLSDLVASSNTRSVKLAPPQMYELHRLHRLISQSKTPNLSYRQGSIRQVHAVRVLSKDGYIISLLERDDLYPMERHTDVFPHTTLHHPQSERLKDIKLLVTKHPQYEYTCDTHTAAQLREMSDNLCRVEFPATATYTDYFCTVYET